MVELDKIKSGIKDLVADIEQAYRNLDNRCGSVQDEEKHIGRLKAEILLLEQQKSNVSQSVKDEQNAANERKKEYTAVKVKYRNLIEEEEKTLNEHKAHVQKEVDTVRIREMARLKAEKIKVESEVTMAKDELANVRAEHRETTLMLKKLKEGIKV